VKLLVCGSRNWWDAGPIRARLAELAPDVDELIHGDARGADTLAAKAAAELGLKLTALPADWEQYGNRAGFIRNEAMLDLEPDLVLAFHKSGSPGTAHTIAEARARGIEVEVRRDHAYCELWTDGSGTSAGPAGFAYVLRWVPPIGQIVEVEGSGPMLEGTNNRAELTAAIEGLRRLERAQVAVVVISDSEYVVHGFGSKRVEKWKDNGWVTGSGSKRKSVANQDLWLELEAEVVRHHCEWVHVRGHAGIRLNERCDELAGAARRQAVAAVQLFDAEQVAA
jgi:ribonuclease HI